MQVQSAFTAQIEFIGSEIHIILESFTASHLADGTLRHPKVSELAG